jgi:hypothetical protein
MVVSVAKSFTCDLRTFSLAAAALQALPRRPDSS